MKDRNDTPRSRWPHTGSGRELLLGFLALGVAATACARDSSSAAPPASGDVTPASGSAIPEVLATIGDDAVTRQDIRDRAGDALDRLELNYRRARHQIVQNALDQILSDRIVLAEAREQGKSIDELAAAEAGTDLEPSESEIQAWYDENRARLGGRSLDQIRDQVVEYLRNQRREEARERLQERLEEERGVRILFEPYRVPLDNEGSPTRGPDDAAVTVTEFSDFQCPFCGRFAPTLRQLQRDFGDDVRVVYRQYPIADLHPDAQKAAEASLCAREQGKFWEMHDLMFQEQDRLGVRDLKEKATRLGLDAEAFDTCLDTGRYVERIQQDQREAVRIGVSGTPAVFLNGIPLPEGAVTYDVAARAIREEIRRVRR